ncbi:vitelline membrane outer layer protein 1-like [Hemicordylus capensis]|uniref:vitelline membrane outer layer protein 1-like n=1 Tax=Hemicordylus capensis TaxID=884348 RepID=UPI0023036ECF|nr:vitelline membrane outer layer protein 1-like [Hemicordylus capensis]XP_053164382.1 vitelline membrane outer layer protein 1-like [Hemicordylus capensis]
MALAVSIFFSLMLSCCLGATAARNYKTIITVKNGGPYGVWGEVQLCPKGYARGFALKVQAHQGIWHDDTALNGIRLYCSNGKVIESKTGRWGEWTEAKYCPKGYIFAFTLRVDPPQGPVADDTSASNVRFACPGGQILTGNSHKWGVFGPWSDRCRSSAICGLQTKVDDQGSADDTGLNDVKFFCCS